MVSDLQRHTVRLAEAFITRCRQWLDSRRIHRHPNHLEFAVSGLGGTSTFSGRVSNVKICSPAASLSLSSSLFQASFASSYLCIPLRRIFSGHWPWGSRDSNFMPFPNTTCQFSRTVKSTISRPRMITTRNRRFHALSSGYWDKKLFIRTRAHASGDSRGFH